MHLKWVVLLLSFWGSCESRLTLPEEKSLEPYLAQCVIEIMSKYFDENMPMVVEAPGTFLSHENQDYDSGDKFIETIQNQVQCSLLMIGEREIATIEHEELHKPGSYIFLIPPGNTNQIIKFLNLVFKVFFGRNYNYYHAAKLVLILTAENNNSLIREENPLFLLRIFIQSGIRDIIVLQPDILTDYRSINNISIFSWNVNEQTNFCNRLDKTKHVDTWISERETFLRDETLFLQDAKLNLRGCEINTCIKSSIPYIDFCNDEVCTPMESVFNATSKSLNVTFVLSRDINRTDKCAINFPCIYYPLLSFHEFNYPHISDDLTWFVPAGSEIPRWQSLFRPFSPILWILVTLTFAFGSFTIWLLQKSAKSSTTDSFVDVLISALSSHLGIGVADGYKCFVAVVFFILWLFYCLVINAAYQSAFYGLLVDPGRFPAIKTVEELEESGLIMERMVDVDFTGPFTSMVNVEFTDPTIPFTIWRSILKYDSCYNFTQCFGNVADKPNRAVLTTPNKYKYHSSCYTDIHKHVPLGEVIHTDLYSLCLYDGYYTFWLIALDTVLVRFITSGLFNFLINKVEFYNKLRCVPDEPEPVFSFSLFHLQGAFYLLLCGLSLSTIVFVTEVFVYFFRRLIQIWAIRAYLQNAH